MKLELEVSEEARRRWALGLCIGGWLAGFGLTLYTIFGDSYPRWLGLVIIYILFIAAAATSANGRRLINDTISATVNTAFRAGLATAQNARSAECVLECDREGYIITARNPEAIGWNEPELAEREMASLLVGNEAADETRAFIKALFAEDASPSVAMGTPMQRVINTGNGGSLAVQLTVSRISDRVIGTLKRP